VYLVITNQPDQPDQPDLPTHPPTHLPTYLPTSVEHNPWEANTYLVKKLPTLHETRGANIAESV
jgi:hypothetical protein